MNRINCIHYCGYSNCAHPDKGWLILGKGCILIGDGFASECKNKTASEPPPIALDIKGKKIGLYIPDPPKPPPKRKICEDIFKVPDIPYIPPMPEVKPPKSGYQMNNDELTRAIASIHAIMHVETLKDPPKAPDSSFIPDSVIHYKTLLSIQKKRAELIVFEDNSKQAQKKEKK